MATRPDLSPDTIAPRVSPGVAPPDGPVDDPTDEPSETLPDQLDPDNPDYCLPETPSPPD